MKKLVPFLSMLLLVATACKKTDMAPDSANEPVKDTTVKKETAVAAAPMDSAAMMKAWQAYATPGEMHKNLAMDNGSWNEKSTMWMSADDRDPTKTTMTAVSKMILGGRYQEMRHTGMMMGQPFEGISTVGYDNASKQMVSTWVDNMSTGIMYMKGDHDTAKSVEYKGQCTDPMTGKLKNVRETFTMIDDNTRKMEMFDTDRSGKEYKSMEIIMTRKK